MNVNDHNGVLPEDIHAKIQINFHRISLIPISFMENLNFRRLVQNKRFYNLPQTVKYMNI